MELKVGLRFKSKWFESVHSEIKSIDEDENTLEVEILRASNHNHIENWNLQHTILGFENGDYIPIPCEHEFVSREYSSQPYGTCLSCGKTVLS